MPNMPLGCLAVSHRSCCRYGGWQRFQQLLQCLKSIADKHRVSLEAVALRWLIDQGTFPVTAARWSASAGPWATFGHTYGLQAGAGAAAAADSAAQDAAAAALAHSASREEGAEQPVEADQLAEQQQQGEAQSEAVVQKPQPPLGGGEAFVPGVDGALYQVASFLDGDDVAALGSLCGAAV
jgi:hypothetical protein